MNTPHANTTRCHSDASPSCLSTNTAFLSNSFTCYHDHDSLSAISDVLNQTCFYFVVFLRNNPPLFHSNRIPLQLLYGDKNPKQRGQVNTSNVPKGNQRNSMVAHDSILSESNASSHLRSHGGLPANQKTRDGDRRQRQANMCPHCASHWSQVYHGNYGVGPSRGRDSRENRRYSGNVGDFNDHRQRLEEVPQQSLQAVAFPTAFGGNGRGPQPPPPPSPLSFFELDSVGNDHLSSMNSPSNAAASQTDHIQVPKSEKLGTVDSPPAGACEGPPWNLRVEELRTAKGALRYYRIILCTIFTAFVASNTGMMHSLQTMQTAVSLVISCPPEGVHLRFLLNHFNILRSMLHRTLGFSMHLVQLYFVEFLSSTNGSNQREKRNTMQHITRRLERSEAAVDAYHQLKEELDNALSITCPLHSFGVTGFLNLRNAVSTKHGVPFLLDCLLTRVGKLSSGSDAKRNLQNSPHLSVSEGLHAALTHVNAISGDFLSAMVTALIAVGINAKRCGAIDAGAGCVAYEGGDPYAAYWELLRMTSKEQGAERQQRTTPTTPTRSLLSHKREEGGGGCRLSDHPTPRIVIFTRNAKLARSLMFIAAFFLRVETSSCASFRDQKLRVPLLVQCDDVAWLESIRETYVCALAAQTRSCAYANVPIQWVCEDFEELCLRSLASGYSPDNDIVVVAPNRLLCYRLRYAKTLEHTTIFIEQGSDGTVCLRDATNGSEPFRCFLEDKSVVEADPVISELLVEALRLHERSNGYISSISVLESTLSWLHRQGRTYQQHYALLALMGKTQQPGSSLPHSEDVENVHDTAGEALSLPAPGTGHATHPHTVFSPNARATRPLSVDRDGSYGSASWTSHPGQTIGSLLLPGSLTEYAGGYVESLRTSSGLVFSATSPSERHGRGISFSLPSARERDGGRSSGLIYSLRSAPSIFPLQKSNWKDDILGGQNFLDSDPYVSQLHRFISEARSE